MPTFNQLVRKGRESVRPIIILVMGMLQSWISQRSLTEGRPVIPEHHRQEVRSALH